MGVNDNKRERVLDVKFNPYRGGITFSFPFANRKSSGRVEIYIMTNLSTLRCSDL